MKSFIFAVLFVMVNAKKFAVPNPKTPTEVCASVDLEGELMLKVLNGSTQLLDVNLAFEVATLMKEESNCETIKILMGQNTVQVWFQVDNKTGQQMVKPISAFAPKDVLSNSNDTDLVVFTAPEFGNFATNQSFKCNSALEHKFTAANVTTYELTVTTKNLQIQFGDVKGYSTDVVECPQDTPTPANTTVTPVTTPATTPQPDNKLHLNVTNGNKTCILLDGYFTIGVTYDTNKTGYLDVPANAMVTGNCSYNSTIQTMEISFDKTWMLGFYFSENKDKDVSISEVKVTYDTSVFKAVKPETKTVSIAKTDFLKASSEGYYLCNSNTTIVGKKDNPDVTVTSKDLKFKAFNTKTTPDFSGDVAECPADEETSSIVPIAVGAALAGLVVIVLIAYLIGRRRQRKSGYEDC